MELSTLSYSGEDRCIYPTETTKTDRWASGVTGVTRRGSHTTMNTGDPCRCPSGGQPVDIRKRNSTGSARESDLPILPLVSEGQHNLGRGKGQYFYHVSEEVKEWRLRGSAENSRRGPGPSEETIPEGKAGEGVPILSSL
jgi:hypothetical protein